MTIFHVLKYPYKERSQSPIYDLFIRELTDIQVKYQKSGELTSEYFAEKRKLYERLLIEYDDISCN